MCQHYLKNVKPGADTPAMSSLNNVQFGLSLFKTWHMIIHSHLFSTPP
jgi:hypothetical protein